jgi:(S)-3,5-dihydroxyphenylglycine transaminase
MVPKLAGWSGTSLRKEELNGSVGDPVPDTINFLNEITFRYAAAMQRLSRLLLV